MLSASDGEGKSVKASRETEQRIVSCMAHEHGSQWDKLKRDISLSDTNLNWCTPVIPQATAPDTIRRRLQYSCKVS